MKELKNSKDYIISFLLTDWNNPRESIIQLKETISNIGNFYIDWQIDKIIQFLSGFLDLNLADRAKISHKLFGGEKKEENAERLINNLFEADSYKKITFIINATRSFLLLDDILTAEMYFRIIRAIVDTQIEDLEFLKMNILSNSSFIENDNVFALSHSGLMRQYSWNAFTNLEQETYVFSALAFKVDRYALSVEDKEHLRLLEQKEKEQIKPQFTVPAVAT